MNYIVLMLLSVMLVLLTILLKQLRVQHQATQLLIADHSIRTSLYQDAEESTSLILSQTLRNVSAGTHDPNLNNSDFALQVVRELVKRKIPKNKWLEIQSNERLLHEIFVLLRSVKL